MSESTNRIATINRITSRLAMDKKQTMSEIDAEVDSAARFLQEADVVTIEGVQDMSTDQRRLLALLLMSSSLKPERSRPREEFMERAESIATGTVTINAPSGREVAFDLETGKIIKYPTPLLTTCEEMGKDGQYLIDNGWETAGKNLLLYAVDIHS